MSAPMTRYRLAVVLLLTFVLVTLLYIASQTPAVFDGATLLAFVVLAALVWVAR